MHQLLSLLFVLAYCNFAITSKEIDENFSNLEYNENIYLVGKPKILTFKSSQNVFEYVKILERLMLTNYFENNALDFEIDKVTLNSYNKMINSIKNLPEHVPKIDSYVKNENFNCVINLDNLSSLLTNLNALIMKSIIDKNAKAKRRIVKRSVKGEEWVNKYNAGAMLSITDQDDYYLYLIFTSLKDLSVVDLDYIIDELRKDEILNFNEINKFLKKESKLFEMQKNLAMLHHLEIPDVIHEHTGNFLGTATEYVTTANELDKITDDTRIQKLTEHFQKLRKDSSTYPIPVLDRISIDENIRYRSTESRMLKANNIISHYKTKFNLPTTILTENTADVTGRKRQRMTKDKNLQDTTEPNSKKNKITTESTILQNDLDLEDEDTTSNLGDDKIEEMLDNNEISLEKDLSLTEVGNDAINDNQQIDRIDNDNVDENNEHIVSDAISDNQQVDRIDTDTVDNNNGNIINDAINDNQQIDRIDNDNVDENNEHIVNDAISDNQQVDRIDTDTVDNNNGNIINDAISDNQQIDRTDNDNVENSNGTVI